MIAVGAKNIYTGEWWPSVFPAIALAFTVLGFALLGEAMVQLPTERGGRGLGPLLDVRDLRVEFQTSEGVGGR